MVAIRTAIALLVVVVLTAAVGSPVVTTGFVTAAPAAQTGAAYPIVGGASSANSNNALAAHDGNRRTSWRAVGAKPPRSAHVLFDLGQERRVGSVRWMFGRTGFADSFRIQTSRDRVSWSSFGRGGNAPAGAWRTRAVDGTARYVRFLFANRRDDRTLGYLAEVEVRSPAGVPAPAPAPAPVAVRPPAVAAPPAPVRPEPNGDPIALGVYTPGSPADGGAIDAFAERIGRMPAVIGMHKAWGDNANWSSFQPWIMDNIVNRGAMPLVVWEPWVPGGGLAQPAYRLANIARGDFDAYVDVWAAQAAADGRPFYLSFAPEMNGDWRSWGAGVNGNTPADYVAAWRRVHDRFAAAGADNVRWVWAPNVADGPYPAMDTFYPGDAYVDWVGLDGYNWGVDGQGKDQWRSFATLFGPSYDILTGLADKPIIVTEFASAEDRGDKAVWIADALQTQLPLKFPRIRAVVWFNFDKERDWRVDSSAASLAAFREAVKTPYLRGTLP